ncbi:MAG: gfo/Idh/MocA family oxidoreductase [Candidatus Latescibacteria bacterium]|nr:gfo/Idh/MocA family oxidoreductase [Candidatus Latescibacterota bacterium]
MSKRYKAGAIGRTGAGDYGHGLETVYSGLEEVDLVAVADADPQGLAAAGQRTGAQRLYADYRQMLEAEQLDLVSVCPRMPDCHAEMVIACAEAGVRGVYIEKPLAPTLQEADALLAACQEHGVVTAVAHRRANPYEQYGKKLVDEGAIGQLKVLRSRGKSDHRAGAQDLAVLGTHMMDSMRYYSGAEVAWAHGHITQGGREIELGDVRQGDERIGLIAGDGVAAYYVFANGVTAHFESHPGYPKGPNSRWFGFEAHGTEGIISLRNSPNGEMYIYRGGMWVPGEENGTWERVLLDEWEQFGAAERTHQSNIMVVRELIEAIEGDRPVQTCSSGEDARAALEMIMAVHESQRLGTRVPLPLANRENPYDTWRRAQG